MSGIDVDVLAEAWANVMDGRRIGSGLRAVRIGRDTTTPDDWQSIAAEYDRLIAAQPDGERITDAHGDELEHGEPDYPGQFETPRERAAREKRDAG